MPSSPPKIFSPSSTAAKDTDTACRPTSVSVRTFLATLNAWDMRACSSGPTVFADCASANASFTCPRICGSPTIIESRLACNPEDVSHRLVLRLRVEQGLDVAEREPPLGAEPAEGGLARFARRLGDAVDLDAIARGQDHHLAEEAAAREVGQDLPDLLLLEGKLLSHVDRRRQVAHAGDEERSDRIRPASHPHGARERPRSRRGSGAARRTR